MNFIPGTPFQNCWELSERLASNIASDNINKIFLPTLSGSIKTIDSNKNDIWSIDLGGEIITQPLYRNEILYILSRVNKSPGEIIEQPDNATYFVSAVNAESGVTIWKKEYKSRQNPRLFSQKGKLVVVLNKSLGSSGKDISGLIVLDGYTGGVTFEKDYDFSIKQYYGISDENIVMLTSINSIVSFSISDGEITFFNTSIRNIQAGAIYSKGIILSDDKGIVYIVDSKSRETKLKIRFGAKVTNIAFYNDRFLISSLDNFIYSVSLDGKQINWKRRLPGRVTDKPVISRDVAVAFSQGDNSLYFINLDDGKVFNRITVPDGEEITGSSVLPNNLIIVVTSKGIKAYSLNDCKNLTAEDR